MPLLAAGLFSFFTWLTTVLAKFVTNRLAVIVAAVSTWAAFTALLVAALNGLASGVHAAVPVEAGFIAGFLPSNTLGCIAAVFAAKVAVWLYQWKMKISKFSAQSSLF